MVWDCSRFEREEANQSIEWIEGQEVEVEYRKKCCLTKEWPETELEGVTGLKEGGGGYRGSVGYICNLSNGYIHTHEIQYQNRI